MASDILDKLKDTIEAIHRCQQEIATHPNEPTLVVNLMSFRKRLVRLAGDAIAEIERLRAECERLEAAGGWTTRKEERHQAFLDAAKVIKRHTTPDKDGRISQDRACDVLRRAAEGVKDGE